MKERITVGIDLAKRVFQVCRIQGSHMVTNKSLKRNELLDYMRRQPPCRVFMEACGGAHYWARQLQGQGHEVKIISPQFVTPLRKGHKTDRNDALAIAEAGGRPSMRFVPHKSVAQQDIQSLHRIRERLVKQRTQLLNQLHGLLLEYGIASGRGQRSLRQTLALALEDAENELSPLLRELLDEQRCELTALNERIEQMDRRVNRLAHAVEPCRRLQAIESIGPVNATLLYSVLADGSAFNNGREAAAYLGVTPKQYSSGGKVKLTGIGRTGHAALRSSLIRGAMSVIQRLGTKDDPKSCWLRALIARTGKHKAAVALANKTIRTAWVLLRHGNEYQPGYGYAL